MAASVCLDKADVPLGRGAARLLSLSETHRHRHREIDVAFCKRAAAQEHGLHAVFRKKLSYSRALSGEPCLSGHDSHFTLNSLSLNGGPEGLMITCY